MKTTPTIPNKKEKKMYEKPCVQIMKLQEKNMYLMANDTNHRNQKNRSSDAYTTKP